VKTETKEALLGAALAAALVISIVAAACCAGCREDLDTPTEVQAIQARVEQMTIAEFQQRQRDLAFEWGVDERPPIVYNPLFPPTPYAWVDFRDTRGMFVVYHSPLHVTK
jgi:hypothetical protein